MGKQLNPSFHRYEELVQIVLDRYIIYSIVYRLLFEPIPNIDEVKDLIVFP